MSAILDRYNEAKAERHSLTLRIAEIDEALALGRAEYMAGNGGGNTPQERANLTAERATLNVRRVAVTSLLEKLRDEAKDARAKTLVRLLCDAMEQRGLQDVIADCRRMASETDPVVD